MDLLDDDRLIASSYLLPGVQAPQRTVWPWCLLPALKKEQRMTLQRPEWTDLDIARDALLRRRLAEGD
jgi:hypothetical protein